MTTNPVSPSQLKLKQTEPPAIKSMMKSLSVGIVVHDKNTKEHLKNKFNQKDLPQLTTNISVTSLKLKNSTQKLLGKQKKQRVSRQ